jgi:hypothetical protein
MRDMVREVFKSTVSRLLIFNKRLAPMRLTAVNPAKTVYLPAAARGVRNSAVAMGATIRPQKCAAQILMIVSSARTA